MTIPANGTRHITVSAAVATAIRPIRKRKAEKTFLVRFVTTPRAPCAQRMRTRSRPVATRERKPACLMTRPSKRPRSPPCAAAPIRRPLICRSPHQVERPDANRIARRGSATRHRRGPQIESTCRKGSIIRSPVLRATTVGTTSRWSAPSRSNTPAPGPTHLRQIPRQHR